MKKIYSLLCTALLLMGLTACEDVPAPYEINEDGPTDSKVLLSETFASSLGKFQNITADGAIEWVNSYSCATATGYDNSTKTNTAGICYLVSPEVDLTEVDSAHVSYEYILRYKDKDEYQKLLIIEAENYNASALDACPWNTIFDAHEEGSDYTTFANADVNIPQAFYGKKVRLALRFQAGTKSGTWEVKNFKVQRGVAGGDGPTPGPDGDNAIPYTSKSLKEGFTVQTEVGAGWSLGSSYAKATGYNGTSTDASKTWLVSPAINTTVSGEDSVFINFDYVLRYVGTSTDIKGFHRVMASTDYAGDVTTATWTDLGFVPVESATRDWTFYAASPIQVPAELLNKEKVYFAFYFECTSDNSTTWELKNLSITQGGVTPTPPGPDGEVKAVTIAEFNSLPVGDTYYQLTGTVSGIKSGDVYGNFDLTDETGTVYVYGLLSEKGGAKKQFQELAAAKGIVDGCTLTIIGKRGDYQGKIEVMDAYFVSVSGGGTPTPPGPTPDPVSLEDFKNGDFETWANGLPTYWKTASTAGNATLAQSTDAHSGSYSVLVKTGGSANKRLGYQEMTLAAGKYAISFYAKGAEGNDAASVRPGYVPIKDDGSVGSYAYGDYTNNITSSEWVQVTHTFELTATTTICLVIMNPKNCGDVLIDDFTIGTVSSAKKRK